MPRWSTRRRTAARIALVTASDAPVLAQAAPEPCATPWHRCRGVRGSLWRTGTGVGVGLLVAWVLAACGSSTSAAVVKHVCGQVSAVLSDGPDPAADPVGYAQAQILPLGQIHTADARLQRAIDALASAYRTFSVDNGVGESAHRAVSAASSKVDALCPGAAS